MTRPQERNTLLSGRFWARMVAINAFATMLAVFTFTNVGWHTPLRSILRAVAISFLFSTCISPFCVYAMTRMSRQVTRRYGFPLNWAILIATLIGIAIAGTLLAVTVLLAIGYIPRTEFVAWFFGGLRQGIVITLAFGISMTAYALIRLRLDEATLALRTKERDEADAQRLAAEAQLAALESRVQPHFLFNTLNSIAALIPDDPSRAEHMTTQLGSLLRSSLDRQTRLVPLDEELRVVRNYLDIERVRFGDRLRYDITVEPGANDARVPRLSVQTLVENSVKYAVSPRREGGSIAVRAAADNGHVRVQISDDGPGFDASTLPEGHGLALLRARLGMMFGDAAALLIHSEPKGTTITLAVPPIR